MVCVTDSVFKGCQSFGVEDGSGQVSMVNFTTPSISRLNAIFLPFPALLTCSLHKIKSEHGNQSLVNLVLFTFLFCFG